MVLEPIDLACGNSTRRLLSAYVSTRQRGIFTRWGHVQQMSDTLSRKVWIENFILSYARKYGSKFTRSTEQKGYRVQLIEVSGGTNLPANP